MSQDVCHYSFVSVEFEGFLAKELGFEIDAQKDPNSELELESEVIRLKLELEKARAGSGARAGSASATTEARESAKMFLSNCPEFPKPLTRSDCKSTTRGKVLKQWIAEASRWHELVQRTKTFDDAAIAWRLDQVIPPFVREQCEFANFAPASVPAVVKLLKK